MDKKIIALTDDDSSIRNSLERTIVKHFDNIEIKQFSSTLELKKFLLNNPNILNLLNAQQNANAQPQVQVPNTNPQPQINVQPPVSKRI